MSGNADYDEQQHRLAQQQTEYKVTRASYRAPLSVSEFRTLQRVNARYDQHQNQLKGKPIYVDDFDAGDRKNLRELEARGDIKVDKDGRLIPGFIFQEHFKSPKRKHSPYDFLMRRKIRKLKR